MANAGPGFQLDEIVSLSVEGHYIDRFHRMQALWFAVADVFTLFIQITGARQSPIQRARN